MEKPVSTPIMPTLLRVKVPPEISSRVSFSIIAPHNASYSETSYWQLRRYSVDEVARVLPRKWPVHFVNPKVKERFIKKWKLEIS